MNKYQLISGFPRSPPLTTIITVCVVTLAEVQRAISDSDSTKWIKIDSKFEWVSGAILESALVGHRMHKLHSLVLALGLSIHTKSQMFSFFFFLVFSKRFHSILLFVIVAADVDITAILTVSGCFSSSRMFHWPTIECYCRTTTISSNCLNLGMNLFVCTKFRWHSAAIIGAMLIHGTHLPANP